MKNKELVINVYTENGPSVQNAILESFEKYIAKELSAADRKKTILKMKA